MNEPDRSMERYDGWMDEHKESLCKYREKDNSLLLIAADAKCFEFMYGSARGWPRTARLTTRVTTRPRPQYLQCKTIPKSLIIVIII